MQHEKQNKYIFSMICEKCGFKKFHAQKFISAGSDLIKKNSFFKFDRLLKNIQILIMGKVERALFFP